MPDLPEGVGSNFRYILIAAKRAEQLIGGARPRLTSRHVKPTTLALDELAGGAVPWRRVTADEYEMLRQQELVQREKEEQAPVLPVPLPIPPIPVEVEAGADEDEELEEELEEAEFDEDLGDVEVVDEAVADELLREDLPD